MLCLILMEDRSKQSYVQAFKEFRKEAPEFSPKFGHCDLESNLIEAFLEVFGNDGFQLTVCWFHFRQVSEIIYLTSILAII